MQILIFTLNAIVIYLLADFIVRAIERKRGAVLQRRQIVFFAIFLALALISFNVLQSLLSSGSL